MPLRILSKFFIIIMRLNNAANIANHRKRKPPRHPFRTIVHKIAKNLCVFVLSYRRLIREDGDHGSSPGWVDLVRYGGITGERRSWRRRWGWTRLLPGAKECSGAPGRLEIALPGANRPSAAPGGNLTKEATPIQGVAPGSRSSNRRTIVRLKMPCFDFPRNFVTAIIPCPPSRRAGMPAHLK